MMSYPGDPDDLTQNFLGDDDPTDQWGDLTYEPGHAPLQPPKHCPHNASWDDYCDECRIEADRAYDAAHKKGGRFRR